MIQHDANALPGGEIPPAGYRLVDMDNDPIRGPEASRLMENIRYCHTLGLPTFFDQMKPWRKVSPTIICGFAPSMQGQLKTIRALKKKKGSTLICANAAHNWLLKKGIKPDIMILLDIDADYIKYVGRPRKGVKYFVASQCAPEVFDHLIKYKADITVWHSWQPEANELVGDPDRRMALYREAEEILVSDVGAVFLWYPLLNEMWKPYVGGEALEPNKWGYSAWRGDQMQNLTPTLYITNDK